MDDCAVPYCRVSRWVQAFQSGKVSSASMHHSGHCHVCLHTVMAVVIIDLCLDEDRFWTVKELPEHVGISGSTVLQILQQCTRLVLSECHII